MAELAYSRPRMRRTNIPPLAVQPRITTSWMVRILLLCSFAFSFLQYWTRTTATNAVHIVILFLAALVVLLGRQRRERLQNILRGGLILVIALLFSEVVSYYSGDVYSLAYGALLIGVILAARLILQQIGLTGVIQAFFQAGLVVTCFLTFEGRKGIAKYTAGNRFVGNSDAHPNLIAFLLAGYLPVIFWRALESNSRRTRRILFAICALNFLLIFLSGSRGALLAVLIAAFTLGARLGITQGMLRHVRLRRVSLLLFLVALPLGAWYLGHNHHIERIGDFLNTALSLNNSQRGLKSGFSGRTAYWAHAIRLIREQDRWLFGFGYRMGDALVGTIDDGYMQLFFETGLVSGGIVLGVILLAFSRLWRLTRTPENSPWFRYYTMLWCTMVIYLFNNITTRYLFSYGNAFSLCIIFLMVASPSELAGRPALAPRTPAPTPKRWTAPRPQLSSGSTL
jgi:O-antigen ligase